MLDLTRHLPRPRVNSRQGYAVRFPRSNPVYGMLHVTFFLLLRLGRSWFRATVVFSFIPVRFCDIAAPVGVSFLLYFIPEAPV